MISFRRLFFLWKNFPFFSVIKTKSWTWKFILSLRILKPASFTKVNIWKWRHLFWLWLLWDGKTCWHIKGSKILCRNSSNLQSCDVNFEGIQHVAQKFTFLWHFYARPTLFFFFYNSYEFSTERIIMMIAKKRKEASRNVILNKSLLNFIVSL